MNLHAAYKEVPPFHSARKTHVPLLYAVQVAAAQRFGPKFRPILDPNHKKHKAALDLCHRFENARPNLDAGEGGLLGLSAPSLPTGTDRQNVFTDWAVRGAAWRLLEGHRNGKGARKTLEALNIPNGAVIAPWSPWSDALDARRTIVRLAAIGNRQGIAERQMLEVIDPMRAALGNGDLPAWVFAKNGYDSSMEALPNGFWTSLSGVDVWRPDNGLAVIDNVKAFGGKPGRGPVLIVWEDLVALIRFMQDRGRYVLPSDEGLTLEDVKAQQSASAAALPAPPDTPLTDAERSVFQHACQIVKDLTQNDEGMISDTAFYGRIARKTGQASETVKTHVRAIKRKRFPGNSKPPKLWAICSMYIDNSG